jgi:DNA-binding transcriptional LysR family regulator
MLVEPLQNQSSLELRHLRYFIAVAEELHFGRAANRLHIAQPPLSQQIRRLEEIIGHRLLERTSRSVALTSAGRAFLDRARRTLAKVHEDLSAVRAVGRGEAGSLTVGFVGSAMLTPLPSVLSRYRRTFPNVNLRLYDYVTTDLLQALRNGSVDVGFLRDGGTHSDLCIQTVWSEPYIAVLSRTHPFARRNYVPLATLGNEPFVFFPRSMGIDAWERTMRLFEPYGFRPQVYQEATQWLIVLRLIGAGLGMTIAPECIREIVDGNVVWRPLRPKGGASTIDIAYRADTAEPIVAAFSALARKAYAEAAQHRASQG